MNVYYSRFINFFTKYGLYDKMMFDYLRSRSIMFDYKDYDFRSFIGCFWAVKGNLVSDINLVVPFISDDITTIINVHEYVHGIRLYRDLGQKYIDSVDKEILPMAYEKLFLLDYSTSELINFSKELNSKIMCGMNIEYRLGMVCSDYVIKMIKNGEDFDVISKKCKKLALKKMREF